VLRGPARRGRWTSKSSPGVWPGRLTRWGEYVSPSSPPLPLRTQALPDIESSTGMTDDTRNPNGAAERSHRPRCRAGGCVDLATGDAHPDPAFQPVPVRLSASRLVQLDGGAVRAAFVLHPGDVTAGAPPTVVCGKSVYRKAIHVSGLPPQRRLRPPGREIHTPLKPEPPRRVRAVSVLTWAGKGSP
jgi:hypothetical protein